MNPANVKSEPDEFTLIVKSFIVKPALTDLRCEKEIMLTFADIDSYRRSAGLSILALSRAARVAPSTYWFIRTGRVRPQLKTLDRYLKALSSISACQTEGVDAPAGESFFGDSGRSALIAAVYRGAMAFIASAFGEDPVNVVQRRSARAYWKIRALALWCASVEFDIRGAELGRAVGLSKQLVSWNLKQANKLQDDPAIRGLVERTGQAVAAREELPE